MSIDRLIDPFWLAAAIISYECDSPHTGEYAEEKPYFPKIDVEQLKEWLIRPHDGDCVKQPQPCARCFADEAKHKADWIIQKASEA